MTAAEAAHKLLALAIRADKLKDDVTGEGVQHVVANVVAAHVAAAPPLACENCAMAGTHSE